MEDYIMLSNYSLTDLISCEDFDTEDFDDETLELLNLYSVEIPQD